ncbi:hypothetical protein [Ramlibacter sp. WS9]|uniref:hypothetical protein n=1 Tax=Ramlibacter sp. WS9 TaxID=1882741 RepID=UPI0011440C90|nr:hypothetical protein [Ramlibacter sp. WS9]ROZ77117.1 hypothetical protein EEB15_11120 [Ramlibacter sp. WS9]
MAMTPPYTSPGRPAGPFWAVTSYYNPAGYQRRRANYRLFRQHLQLPLLTVEWSHDGRFELGPGDADILIQLDGGDVMWQKERLLNIGIARLPAECTKVAWLDCDVVFENTAWPKQALAQLENARLVQLFEHVVHIMPTPIERLLQDASWRGAGVLKRRTSTARLYCDAKSAGNMDMLGVPPEGQSFAYPGSNGHAWAAHRSLLEDHPLFDAWVLGGGDAAYLYAAAGLSADQIRMCGLAAAQASHYLQRAAPLERAIDGRLAWVPGTLLHLWHGDPADRKYRERYTILERHGFDPRRFLKRSASGVWEWADVPSGLPDEIRAYFEQRNEDGLVTASASA